MSKNRVLMRLKVIVSYGTQTSFLVIGLSRLFRNSSPVFLMDIQNSSLDARCLFVPSPSG